MAMIAWLLAGTPALHAAAAEYQLKAVYLFSFARYVEWPATAFADAQEKVNGHLMVIRHFSHGEDVGKCHVLFISRSESDSLERILGALKGRSTLAVGDVDSFNERGGMIRFVTENNKVRLKINLDAAKTANLTISSKLLRAAEIVSLQKT